MAATGLSVDASRQLQGGSLLQETMGSSDGCGPSHGLWADHAACATLPDGFHRPLAQLDIRSKLAYLCSTLHQAHHESLCMLQTWKVVSDPGTSMVVAAEAALGAACDPHFHDFRAASCSAPLAFSKGLAPRVARSGSVQVVQSLRIIPPSMHPRAALCAGAMSRVSEVLYLPLFDSSRAGHGPVAVLEAFMSVRSVAPCQPADLISYVASAASDLGMSVHTPEAEEPVEAMSMLRGRRARPSHDAASSRDAAPWGAARQCSDGLSEATERQPQLSSATQPHLSTAAPPRLSSATQPHLSTATQPHLSSATQPHLSSAALPHLSSAPQPHLSTAAPAAAGTSHAMAGTSSTAEQGHAFRTPGLATMAGAPRPATCAHPCTITQPHGVGSGSGGRSGGVNVGGAAGFGGSLMASSSTPLDGALHANCMVSVDHEMASSAPYHAFVMSGAGRRTFCSGGGDVVAVRGAAHRRSLGARPMSGMVRSQSMFRMPAPDEPAPGCGCDMGVDVAMAASVMQNSGRLSALGESTAC